MSEAEPETYPGEESQVPHPSGMKGGKTLRGSRPEDVSTHEVSERSICPEHALGRDALSRLTEVHGDHTAQEVLDLVAVRIRGDPTRSSNCNTAEHEGWEME